MELPKAGGHPVELPEAAGHPVELPEAGATLWNYLKLGATLWNYLKLGATLSRKRQKTRTRKSRVDTAYIAAENADMAPLMTSRQLLVTSQGQLMKLVLLDKLLDEEEGHTEDEKHQGGYVQHRAHKHLA